MQCYRSSKRLPYGRRCVGENRAPDLILHEHYGDLVLLSSIALREEQVPFPRTGPHEISISSARRQPYNGPVGTIRGEAQVGHRKTVSSERVARHGNGE